MALCTCSNYDFEKALEGVGFKVIIVEIPEKKRKTITVFGIKIKL